MSPVDPTTTIGGAPAPEAGAGVRCDGTDQNAQGRSLNATARNRGATFRRVAASFVYVETSVDDGKSRQVFE